MPAHPTDNQRAGDERVASFTAATASPVLGREVLLVLDRPAHRARLLCIGDRLMRVFGGHRPVDERARRVAVAQGRFAVLSVLKDHRIGAAADRGGLPYARRLDRLDADRSRREQSTEQHPLIAEPDTNRLIPVVRLERLTPVQGDVVREHDLAIVTANDAFAPGQLDQDGSHDSIVATGTTQSIRTEPIPPGCLAAIARDGQVAATISRIGLRRPCASARQPDEHTGPTIASREERSGVPVGHSRSGVTDVVATRAHSSEAQEHGRADTAGHKVTNGRRLDVHAAHRLPSGW